MTTSMTHELEDVVRAWLNDDKSEHTRLAISVAKVSIVCRSMEIAGYLWHSGRLTLPDGRRFRIAWSQKTDIVVVGKQI
jgi:hypothetical protein